MKGKAIIKGLQIIAGKEISITRGVHPQWYDRAEVIVEAYGWARVQEDFQAWCAENKALRPQYPVSDYLKVVDTRLGNADPEEEKDPRIERLSSLTFRLTERLPNVRDIRKVLQEFTEPEIESALREYVGGLDEREYSYAARNFFADGGCAAIISARKSREEERKQNKLREDHEKNLIASLVDAERRKSDEETRQREAERPQTADDLFGPERS